jgi:hypothetical protein
MPFNLAPIIETGRQIAADFRFDTYRVIRTTRTPDGEGGWASVTAIEEQGAAVLTAGATRPDERALADRVQSASPYVLRNLPHTTVLRADDTVEVNGRTFQVLGVLRTEAANVAVTAVLEERS